MHQSLLTLAELLQTLGGIVLPADPGRTAAQTELLLERKYAELEIIRFKCSIEPEAPDMHTFQLEDEGNAEVAMVSETPAEQRTKMMLARALDRNEELLDGESMQGAFNKNLADLTGRTAHLFPAPVLAPAPAAPRGRGGGRGGRGRGGRGGRGRGRG